jgi:hypothetical protein
MQFPTFNCVSQKKKNDCNRNSFQQVVLVFDQRNSTISYGLSWIIAGFPRKTSVFIITNIVYPLKGFVSCQNIFLATMNFEIRNAPWLPGNRELAQCGI